MTVVIDGTEYLPASEAALQLGTTETKILMLLKQKALGGELLEGSWFVTTASLACYDAHAPGPEKKAHCGSGCSGCH
jgi:hypothetical protein